MSGHSKWATIKRQKGVNDAKRGAMFTRYGNAIAIAAKSGGDPDMNPGLALAVEKAKSVNMPKANIERSIKRGTGELGGAIIEEMTYEGYGPVGIAVIVECASDNRNRTYSDVRTAFSKNGGNMAETGAVSFMFDRKGVIEVTKNSDDDELVLIEAGAEDILDEDSVWMVHTSAKELNNTKTAIIEAGLKVTDAKLAYIPQQVQEITEQKDQDKIEKFMDVLDELDDVVETHTNFEFV